MTVDEILSHRERMCNGIKRDVYEPDKVTIMVEEVLFDIIRLRNKCLVEGDPP